MGFNAVSKYYLQDYLVASSMSGPSLILDYLFSVEHWVPQPKFSQLDLYTYPHLVLYLFFLLFGLVWYQNTYSTKLSTLVIFGIVTSSVAVWLSLPLWPRTLWIYEVEMPCLLHTRTLFLLPPTRPQASCFLSLLIQPLYSLIYAEPENICLFAVNLASSGSPPCSMCQKAKGHSTPRSAHSWYLFKL